MVKPTISLAPAMALLLASILSLVDGLHTGVCLGLKANDLPLAPQIINLYKSKGIEMLRLYNPHHNVLDAIRGSGLSVVVGMPNDELESYGWHPDAAAAWVENNIVPYKNDVNFKWIVVGNDLIPDGYASNIFSAMKNIRSELKLVGLTGVKVTTVVSKNALLASFPPSAGTFTTEPEPQIMSDICSVLIEDHSPLMINVYPYLAYTADPDHISLDHALFNAMQPLIVDGGLSYYNLFDASVDAFNAALEKINCGNVKVAVSESGRPTAGNAPYTSISKAQTYNKNLLQHVMKTGTARRPKVLIEAFLYGMFNENLKDNQVEQNYGFFYPNMQPVYPFW